MGHTRLAIWGEEVNMMLAQLLHSLHIELICVSKLSPREHVLIAAGGAVSRLALCQGGLCAQVMPGVADVCWLR